MFIAVFLLNVFFSGALCLRSRHKFLGSTTRSGSYLELPDEHELRDIIKKDLAAKVDEIVALIVKDVESAMDSHNATGPSFFQNDFKANTKRIIKETVVSILKHMLPIFEKWIAEAVKPPVSGPILYSSMVKPVAKSIFDQVNTKLNIPVDSHLWDLPEYQDEDSFDVLDDELLI